MKMSRVTIKIITLVGALLLYTLWIKQTLHTFLLLTSNTKANTPCTGDIGDIFTKNLLCHMIGGWDYFSMLSNVYFVYYITTLRLYSIYSSLWVYIISKRSLCDVSIVFILPQFLVTCWQGFFFGLRVRCLCDNVVLSFSSHFRSYVRIKA